ncbi:large subunit of N,N-dimethylformamidase [soil metagenome]
MKIVGYSDVLSVEPGETITFMVSSHAPKYRSELIRLIHGDDNPVSPGFKYLPVHSYSPREHDGEYQELRPGSFLTIPDDGALGTPDALSVQLWLQPTTPQKRHQTLVSRRDREGNGFALRLDANHLVFEFGDLAIRSEAAIDAGRWYFAAATYDFTTGSARIVVDQVSGVSLCASQETAGTLPAPTPCTVGELLIGAEYAPEQDRITNFFNGKIEAPALFGSVLTDLELEELKSGADSPAPLASFDFTREINSWNIHDISGHGHHGRAVNKPTRAVTGRHWDGTEMSWRNATEQYGAIHFHDDDLNDAGWEPSLSWTVPENTTSGVYAMRLDTGDDQDYLPFFITPRRGEPQSAVALVIPTFSYLAYSNEQMFHTTPALSGSAPESENSASDTYIVENRLLSNYDVHSDGSGNCYTSWLRPMVNIRPGFRTHWLAATGAVGAPHQLAADLYLVDWLHEKGCRVDILTDVEVHRDGGARLADYTVVLSGTHAEYWSAAMLAAFDTYLNGGGRFMYMSGNGAYWVTAFDENTGSGIEIRRQGPAQRTWDAAPGEGYMSTTGECAGLWRNRGHSPHTWLGTGSVSEGAGEGRPYHRQPDSHDPRASFVFREIGEDELIGAIPSLVNSWGAAGFEIDRYDPDLGSPAHTMVLASAQGFNDSFLPFSEYTTIPMRYPPTADNPLVRADMTLLSYPNGGAVFAVGSINWAACLFHNGYVNTVSRVTENVLTHFLDATVI